MVTIAVRAIITLLLIIWGALWLIKWLGGQCWLACQWLDKKAKELIRELSE